MEIRHLAPPKLDLANLGQRIVGHRPCRECNPQMCVEQNGQGRLLAQNYGHGGSGWTLAPGAVEFVNDKLVEAIGNFEGADERMEGKSKSQIQIVGAGVIGLFTAYDLLKRGFTNLTIVAADFDELTSHNAGGLICPFALKIGDTVIKDWLEGMALNAYKYFAQIARGENADFPAECAKIMPLYLDIGTTEGLDAYVKKGLMAPAKEVLVQFDGCQRQRKMMAFEDAIFVQTHQMMQILRRILESKGVKFVQHKVDSLDELEGKVVVNCTGMGARELCSDAKMHSAQGHLIMLKDQNPSDLNYMMVHWFENGKTASGHIVERCFYIFPKCSSQTDERAIGVLGGTFVQDADEHSPNLEEFDRLLANAKAFLSGQI